jgi:DNA-binding XRE family transcriptional regulator
MQQHLAGPLTTVTELCRTMAVIQSNPTNLRSNPSPPRPRAQSFDKRLGAAIRHRRILLGLTQIDLAEVIGVTYQQAYKYEKGINRVSAGRLVDIAAALQMPVAELLARLSNR